MKAQNLNYTGGCNFDSVGVKTSRKNEYFHYLSFYECFCIPKIEDTITQMKQDICYNRNLRCINPKS